MSSPRELWNTPLVDETRFVNVNKDTLQHNKYKNIFAIGDCGNTPTSKTAAATGRSSVLTFTLVLTLPAYKLLKRVDV